MRTVRIQVNNKIKYGIIEQNNIIGYRGKPFSNNNILGNFFRPDGTVYRSSEVVLLAPCEPSKIVCLGVNYRSHASEFDNVIPQKPLIFLKPSTAIIGPEANIILPHNGRIDHECELAIVIGKRTSNITETEVYDHILGYTCFNDISDRVAQKEDGQWTRAKGYDTFAPIGPWIETELDANNLIIETYLNGECKQRASTSDLIFGIPKLVSFISSIMTLLPGDVIATGTPAGVSPLKNGDQVEIKIEKIGTLRNYVVNKHIDIIS